MHTVTFFSRAASLLYEDMEHIDRWVVGRVCNSEFQEIETFYNKQDAYRFCNYLNGGNGDRSLNCLLQERPVNDG